MLCRPDSLTLDDTFMVGEKTKQKKNTQWVLGKKCHHAANLKWNSLGLDMGLMH